MSKSEVEEQRLGEYVIMPSDAESSFKVWWRSTDLSATVDVRYPINKHENALKPSNSAKLIVMEEFLYFVDLNSQHNGWAADSSRRTHYFQPMFTTIQAPKPRVVHYEE